MNMTLTRFLFYICGFIFIVERISCGKTIENSHFILIQNDFVTCYLDRFVVHYYYFPFGDKTIKYSDIHSCDLLRANDLNFFETKCWGMAFSSVWWHLDIRRQWREYYLILDVNQWPKIGMTMDDSDLVKVYDLIQEKIASNSNSDSDKPSNHIVDSMPYKTL